MPLLTAVADASALIGLAKIGRLNLLKELFVVVVIPLAVCSEVRTVTLPPWVEIVPLAAPEKTADFCSHLGPGEREAIVLANQLQAYTVILDDRDARIEAQRRGLPVMGVVGLLLAAKKAGHLAAIRADLDALISVSFHVSPRLYWQALLLAGEL